MGNPRNIPGRLGNVGNATVGGVSQARSCTRARICQTDGKQFAARPAGYQCQAFAGIIRSYCDEADPFCAKGNSTATHQGYGQVYGQDALGFVTQKLTMAGVSRSDAIKQKGSGGLIIAVFIILFFTFVTI